MKIKYDASLRKKKKKTNSFVADLFFFKENIGTYGGNDFLEQSHLKKLKIQTIMFLNWNFISTFSKNIFKKVIHKWYLNSLEW